MSTQERFAEDFGIDIDRVGVMVRLGVECGKLNEHACNGDPHPKNKFKRDDKAENSRLWEHDLATESASLERYAQQYGFASVAYTGLYPCLMTKDGKYVDLPY